MIFVSCFELFI